MKVLLAYKADPEGSKDPFTSLLPVGLGYLNAVLREEGYRSRVANLSRHSWRECTAILAQERPDLFGISLFTHNRGPSMRLAELARKAHPACVIVAGGPHATHRAAELLAAYPCLDAVVAGEGEETLLELARLLAAGDRAGIAAIPGLVVRRENAGVRTPARPPIADLDQLPIPARYLGDAIGVDLHRQLEFIVTSRGCPAACRFCSSPRFWGRSLRFRSPRAIVDEIRFIRDQYGLIYFSFRDDTFTADRQRVIELCQLLIQERLHILWNCQSRVTAVDAEMLGWMRRAGCECIQYGVESGSPRVLATLGKRITPEQIRRAAVLTRGAGINLSIYLITGVPGETEQDLRANLKMIRELGAVDGQVSPLAYYPGTRLFEEAVQGGRAPADLFERDTATGFYVRQDRFTRHATDAVLGAVWETAGKSRFTGREYASRQRELGWCHGTAIMAGEYYQGEGDLSRARREYLEIIRREPDNPWGWLMLAELCREEGDKAGAEDAYLELLALVPRHTPAHVALGELRELAGDPAAAERHYRRALKLNPGDTESRKALQRLGRSRHQ